MSSSRRNTVMVAIILVCAGVVVVQAMLHGMSFFGPQAPPPDFVEPVLPAGFERSESASYGQVHGETAATETEAKEPVEPWRAYALERMDPRWLARQRGQALAALSLAPDPFAAPGRDAEVPEPPEPVPAPEEPVVASLEALEPGTPTIRVTATLVGASGNLAVVEGQILREGDEIQTSSGRFRIERIQPREVLLEVGGLRVAIPVQDLGPSTPSRGQTRSPPVIPDLEIDH